MKYKIIKDITSSELKCGAYFCPAIYEGVKEVTPEEEMCFFGACPRVYETKREGKGVYLIIGKQIKPSEVELGDLEKKIGEGEVLIEIPRDLIDKMRR